MATQTGSNNGGISTTVDAFEPTDYATPELFNNVFKTLIDNDVSLNAALIAAQQRYRTAIFSVPSTIAGTSYTFYNLKGSYYFNVPADKSLILRLMSASNDQPTNADSNYRGVQSFNYTFTTNIANSYPDDPPFISPTTYTTGELSIGSGFELNSSFVIVPSGRTEALDAHLKCTITAASGGSFTSIPSNLTVTALLEIV